MNAHSEITRSNPLKFVYLSLRSLSTILHIHSLTLLLWKPHSHKWKHWFNCDTHINNTAIFGKCLEFIFTHSLFLFTTFWVCVSVCGYWTLELDYNAWLMIADSERQQQKTRTISISYAWCFLGSSTSARYPLSLSVS